MHIRLESATSPDMHLPGAVNHCIANISKSPREWTDLVETKISMERLTQLARDRHRILGGLDKDPELFHPIMEDPPRAGDFSDTHDRLKLKTNSQRDGDRNDSLAALLAELWTDVVYPIVAHLGLKRSTGRERPRVWWHWDVNSPVAPVNVLQVLPFHAAGIHFGTTRFSCASNYFVSSYAPEHGPMSWYNIRRLNAPGTELEFWSPFKIWPPPRSLNCLLISQSTSPGLPNLPNAKKEADIIRDIVPAECLLGLGGGSAGSSNFDIITSDTILQSLLNADMVHFACHGSVGNTENETGFHLTNGETLTSTAIGRLISRPQARVNAPEWFDPMSYPQVTSAQTNSRALFAFLSACDSGRGASLSRSTLAHEKSMAGIMADAVGFKSVIGTMWDMHDIDGPRVAEVVYREMFRDLDGPLDPEVIPYTLDEAVRLLRDVDGLPPARWATYIHYGV